MNEHMELLGRVAAIGIGATLVMDGWAAILRRFGIASLDPAMLGRWVGHFPRGRFVHARIADAAPVRGERALGVAAHYGIGIGFAAVLTTLFGSAWLQAPSIGPALLVGVVTVLAPWFVLQPALGAGVASSRTPRPVFAAGKSLVTHVVFGLGLWGAARLTAALCAAVAA